MSDDVQVLQFWDDDLDDWVQSHGTRRVTDLSLADAWGVADAWTASDKDMQYRIAIRRTETVTTTVEADRPVPTCAYGHPIESE